MFAYSLPPLLKATEIWLEFGAPLYITILLSVFVKFVLLKIDKFGKVFLDSYYYNYSRTTSKYRNMFLNMTTKEIEKGIKDNEIALVNLNA